MEISITSNKGQIVIPSKLRKKYSIKQGTRIVFIDSNGKLIIKPLTKEYFESFAGILKGDVIGELMKEKQKEKER